MELLHIIAIIEQEPHFEFIELEVTRLSAIMSAIARYINVRKCGNHRHEQTKLYPNVVYILHTSIL